MRIAAAIAFLAGLALTAGADWYTAVLYSDGGDNLNVEIELDKVHVDSTLGIFDIEGAKIRHLEQGKEKQGLTLTDGTELKGKISIEALKLRSKILGPFELSGKGVFNIEVKGPAAAATAEPAERPAAKKQTVNIATVDGNRIQGTLEVETIEVKSALGTFKVRMEDVGSIQFDRSRLRVFVKGNSLLAGTSSQAKWPIVSGNLGRVEVAIENMQNLTRVELPGGEPAPPVKQPPPAPANALRRLTSAVALSCFHVSPDGKTLHALDPSGPRLLVFSLESLTQQSDFPLPAGTTSVAFDFTGKIAATCANDMVSVIDPENGKVTHSFRVEGAIREAVPLGPDLLIASTSQDRVVAIVPSKQAIVKGLWGDRAYSFRFHPDGHRLYASELTIHVPDNPTPETIGVVQRRSASRPEFNPAFSVFSEDGSLAVTPQGLVLLPGKSDLADLQEIGKVEPHIGALFSGGRLFVFTSAGFMKTYDTKTLEITSSTALDFVVWFAVADRTGKVLTLYGKPVKTDGGMNGIPYDRKFPPGDFVQIPAPE